MLSLLAAEESRSEAGFQNRQFRPATCREGYTLSMTLFMIALQYVRVLRSPSLFYPMVVISLGHSSLVILSLGYRVRVRGCASDFTNWESAGGQSSLMQSRLRLPHIGLHLEYGK